MRNGILFLGEAAEEYWILEAVVPGHQNMAWDEPSRGRLKSISFEPGKIGHSLETFRAGFFSPFPMFCM